MLPRPPVPVMVAQGTIAPDGVTANNYTMPSLPPFPTFRAEHIGSLLRPPELLAARTQFEGGRGDAGQLRAAEDAAIRDVVRRQEALGLKVVTDGEFRRDTYSDSFTTSRHVRRQGDGDRGRGLARIRHARPSHGAPHPRGWSAEIAWAGRRERARLRVPQGGGAGRRPRSRCRARPISTTAPAASNISRQVYPDLEAFWADLVAAYHAELARWRKRGADYVQIDETSLVKLGDPRAQATPEGARR